MVIAFKTWLILYCILERLMIIKHLLSHRTIRHNFIFSLFIILMVLILHSVLEIRLYRFYLCFKSHVSHFVLNISLNVYSKILACFKVLNY